MDADLQHAPEEIPGDARGGPGRRRRGGGQPVRARRQPPRPRRRPAAAWSAGRPAPSPGRSSARPGRARDPLSGFFLCRRRVIDGIEFRPVGFKILLELLVCVPGPAGPRRPPRLRRARRSGASKASVRQGLLFLGHIRSLVFDVQGSARPWKFGLVGVSGLAILLPLVGAADRPRRTSPPLAAFLLAYPPSLVWNTALNRAWTFADQRHGLRRGHRPVPGARLPLRPGHVRRVRDLGRVGRHRGAGGDGGGGDRHGGQRPDQPRRSASPTPPVERGGPQPGSAGGPRSPRQRDRRGPHLLCCPPPGPCPPASRPGLVERAVEQRRGVLFTEAAGHRAQRRSNIEVSSTLLVPVVDGRAVAAVLVCERRDPHAVRRRAARRRHERIRWRSRGSSSATAARTAAASPRGGPAPSKPRPAREGTRRRSCWRAPTSPPAGAPRRHRAHRPRRTDLGRAGAPGRRALPAERAAVRLARQEYQGIEIARDMVNMDGGVHGVPVQLDSRELDDPSAAAAAVQSLRGDGVSVVLGTYSSALSVPASAAASTAGLTYWEAGAVADRVTGRALPNVFRVGASGANLGSNSATFAATVIAPRLGRTAAGTRVSVVLEDDDYGHSVADNAVISAHAQGMNVVSYTTYNAIRPGLAARARRRGGGAARCAHPRLVHHRRRLLPPRHARRPPPRRRPDRVDDGRVRSRLRARARRGRHRRVRLRPAHRRGSTPAC